MQAFFERLDSKIIFKLVDYTNKRRVFPSDDCAGPIIDLINNCVLELSSVFGT